MGWVWVWDWDTEVAEPTIIPLSWCTVVHHTLASYPGHLYEKWPGNLSEFKLLTSAALELAVPIRFQNTFM